jgi:hypothetical protein
MFYAGAFEAGREPIADFLGLFRRYFLPRKLDTVFALTAMTDCRES